MKGDAATRISPLAALPAAPPGVSIVLCTHNREHRLIRTLRGIAEASVPRGVTVEILVVDNNSHDGTAAAVAAYSTADPRVRYLFEPRPGKCRALNAGVAAARGEVVAFLDDDVIPDTRWLESIWREFSADPDLVVLGGRVELANPLDLPITICRDSDRRWVRTYLDVDDHFFGCCWAARRQVLAATGDFDADLGPGTRFPAAEDADYTYRLWRAGYRMLYAPTVLVFHDHGRRTPEAARTLLQDYNIGRGAFYAKYILQGDLNAAKLMYWTLLSRARRLVKGRDIAFSLRTSWWLSKGFAGYLWRRLRHSLPSSRAIGAAPMAARLGTGDRRP